jgi:hypothetical protein
VKVEASPICLDEELVVPVVVVLLAGLPAAACDRCNKYNCTS